MIVITGGSGFIGSNLVKFLNDNNEKDILVVEELDSYVKKFENLKDLSITKGRGNIIKLKNLLTLSKMISHYMINKLF